jgi:hypothetical protein
MTSLRYEEIQKKSQALLDKHGIKGWRVSVENLQKPMNGCSCLGYADFETKTIRICWSKPREFRQTFLHEIAHVLHGIPGHGWEWIAIAEKIGCTFTHLLPYAKALHSKKETS